MGMEGAVSDIQDYDVATLYFMIIIEMIPLCFLLFIGIKRLHDCNYRGWWILVPLVFLVIWIVAPTQGINRFGDDPRDDYIDDYDGDFEKDYSWLGVIAIALLYNFALISQAVEEQKKSVNHQNPTPVHQANHTSAPNISPSDIKTPNISNEPQLNPQLVLAEAKNRYDNAVSNINAVWNSLHPSTQEFLRAEQRAINKREKRTVPLMAMLKAQIKIWQKLIVIFARYHN